MNSYSTPNRAIWFKIVSAASFLLSFPVHAIIDSNSNGLSDLWEENYNQLELFPPTFDPQADPDNDGWTNAQEAAAGTDPRDPMTRKSDVTWAGGSLDVSRRLMELRHRKMVWLT